MTNESHLGQRDGRDAPAPSAAALRMRRHRERRRDGLRCVTIELRETEVSALIRKGLLSDDARNDLKAVKRAFYGFLDRTLIHDAQQAGNRLPIERWTRDCLDVRFLKREGFLDSSWVAIGPSLRWPRIARMRIARYLLILDLQGQCPAHIRASWTRLHFGGDRPWLHCPHCERRVAKLYRGLAGYFCRACVGNPPYATQLLSAGGRAHSKAIT